MVLLSEEPNQELILTQLIHANKACLERWYAAIAPLLKTYYGTGGDMNVDQNHEVIPILRNMAFFTHNKELLMVTSKTIHLKKNYKL